MKTSSRISPLLSVVLFVTSTLFVTTSFAQWFGPWGNENDLAAAWGLEPDSIDDPDEGPGETINYNNFEKPFRMNVESGSQAYNRPIAPPKRVRPIAAPAPKPKPAAPVAAAPVAAAPQRRPMPPRASSLRPPQNPGRYYRRQAPRPPRGYGNSRRPIPPMPYYGPRPPMPPMVMQPRAMPLSPYPYRR